jgi:hypothetical protein
LLLAAAAVGSCGDKIVDVATVPSPDGKVLAQYQKYYYGGAAGGTSHCISVMKAAGEDKKDCVLLGVSTCITKIHWQDHNLIVEYYLGEFARMTNEISFADAGERSTYRLIVKEVENGRPCLSEWDNASPVQ